MIANEHGIDFYEIHKAMTQNYPRAQGFPKAGFAAGPCLFKDTMQLSAFHNNAFFLGHTAMLVNEGLPNYVVQGALRRYDLKKMKAGILGMTFKADCDDPRDSLAFKLRKILQLECQEVLCSDPYLKGEEWSSLDTVLSQADILFVGVPHKEYRSLNCGNKPVIDIWNAIHPQ
jgi:UDP-N-acetyl-D-mannosaminuronic acid dehydrogenase